jgi:hypothetical protein
MSKGMSYFGYLVMNRRTSLPASICQVEQNRTAEFTELKRIAIDLGIGRVESGPPGSNHVTGRRPSRSRPI